MHRTDHSRFRKRHDFVPDFSHAERRTRIVIGITAAMMVVEIVGRPDVALNGFAGRWLAHEHACPGVPHNGRGVLFRPNTSRQCALQFRHRKNRVLGGFTSAVVLAIVAFLMAGESVHRLFAPLEIHFNEAIGIACLGLLVNLGCAVLLADRHHEHDGGSAHDHDLNLRAAYMHVLADAFTSVLAITALTGGKFFGWAWLDPVVGIVGSGVVFSWSYTLLRDTSGILLDRTPPSSDLPDEIRRAVESDGDSVVTDLHVWQVGIGKFAAMVSIVAHEPKSCDSYRALLRGYRRTGPRDNRDAPLPRRPRVGRKRLGVC